MTRFQVRRPGFGCAGSLALLLMFSFSQPATAAQRVGAATGLAPVRAGAATETSPGPEEYPYADAAPGDDPWGYEFRGCDSYAAWWLSTHGITYGPGDRTIYGPNGFLVGFIAAADWDVSAVQAGYEVGTVPVVGAIAQWHVNEVGPPSPSDGHVFVAGDQGHVAVVIGINADGSVQLAQYGDDDQPSFDIVTGAAPRYLYMGITPPSTGLITYDIPPLQPDDPSSVTPTQLTPVPVGPPAAEPVTPIAALIPAAPVAPLVPVNPTLVAKTTAKVPLLPPASSRHLRLARADRSGRDFWLPRSQYWKLAERVRLEVYDPETQRSRLVTGTVLRLDKPYILRLSENVRNAEVRLTVAR